MMHFMDNSITISYKALLYDSVPIFRYVPCSCYNMVFDIYIREQKECNSVFGILLLCSLWFTPCQRKTLTDQAGRVLKAIQV
jgi:hypothetical protein